VRPKVSVEAARIGCGSASAAESNDAAQCAASRPPCPGIAGAPGGSTCPTGSCLPRP
jgi:hypothetical protein